LIRVLLADDHPIVLKGLRQLVSEAGDMVVSAEAGDSTGVLRWLGANPPPDVLVLDINMPGRSGLDIIRDVKRSYPSVAVLILSSHPEDQLAVRTLKAGASGYLNKESAPEQLAEAIRRVYSGGKYISPALAATLVETMQRPPAELAHESLSAREYSVLVMIAGGKTVSEIAGELCLSVKTVSTYRARVLEKMSLRTNSELTRYAFENRLVT